MNVNEGMMDSSLDYTAAMPKEVRTVKLNRNMGTVLPPLRNGSTNSLPIETNNNVSGIPTKSLNFNFV